MKVLRRGVALAVGLAAVGLVGPVGAQENLDQGKSPAQLFNSDCALCHKTPQGLAARAGALGLESFLREHYTASKESAAAIANYLRAAGNAPAAGPRAAKRKPDDKTGDKKDDKTVDKDKKDEKASDRTDEKSADKKPDVKDTKPADKPKSAKTDNKTDNKSTAATVESEGGKSGGVRQARPKKPADSDKPN